MLLDSLCSTGTGELLCSTIVKCVPGGDLLPCTCVLQWGGVGFFGDP